MSAYSDLIKKDPSLAGKDKQKPKEAVWAPANGKKNTKSGKKGKK